MPIAHRPFRMIAAPVCLMGLQACATVPMAPLVYGSKTVGGFDISTSTGANPSVSISLGKKMKRRASVSSPPPPKPRLLNGRGRGRQIY